MEKNHNDPTAGIMLVGGSSILHLAMLIAMLLVDTAHLEGITNEDCQVKVEYRFIIFLMRVVHSTCFLLLLFNLMAHRCGKRLEIVLKYV